MQMGQAHKRQQIRLSGEKSSPVGGDGGLRLGAELYTGPGGARSGGYAAGTLRGVRRAGVPAGTQCAPCPHICSTFEKPDLKLQKTQDEMNNIWKNASAKKEDAGQRN